MARKTGSKDTKKRATKQSAYEAYSYWYDRYTRETQSNLYSRKYTRAEFEDQYELTKRAKMTNPARTVARSQSLVDDPRKFERRYRQLYNETVPVEFKTDKAVRQEIFENFVNDLVAQGMTYDEARAEFERYFY